MATRELTFQFGGRVKATIVLRAMAGLVQVVEGLTEEFLRDNAEELPDLAELDTEWTLGDDEGSRFESRLIGQGAYEPLLKYVAREAVEVQRSIHRGEVTPHSARVERGASAFLGSVNGYIKSAALISSETEPFRLTEKLQTPARVTTQVAELGALEGRLRGLEEDGRRVEIVVLDRTYRTKVRCRITEDQVHQAKEAFRERVILHGRIVRNAETGVPIRMTSVTAIEQLPPIDRTAFSRAAGIWEIPEDHELLTVDDLDLIAAGIDGE